MKITQDERAPTATVELMIERPLEEYDLVEIEAAVPRDVDPMLASQGFKDLLDEARAILGAELEGRGLEVVQLTGAICRSGDAYRPGIWLVVKEAGAQGNAAMTAGAAGGVKQAAGALEKKLGLC